MQVNAHTFTTARQAIALSLALQKKCAISIDQSLITHTHYNRTLNAIVSVLRQFNVDISYNNGVIIINPVQLPALTATITLHPFCSITDILMTIAPALATNRVHSYLTLFGVTHCQYSHSTGFIRFGLAHLLQQAGCFVHCATKKFGFYTATGMVHSKVYPPIQKHIEPVSTHTRITGIRIYIANIDPEFALYQKKELCSALALSEDSISILQITNVTNHGNAIDVFFATGDIPGMLSFTMPLYDDTGNFVFEDSMMKDFLQNVISTCKASYEYIPLPIVQEAIPFLLAIGHDCDTALLYNPGIQSTESYLLARMFS